MSTPFDESELRDWLFEQVKPRWIGEAKDGIALSGAGPFEQNDFAEFLSKLGYEVVELPAAVGLVVVGRFGVDPQALDDQIELLAGRSLRVYSQEMFLAHLLGADPFASERVLKKYLTGHGALDHVYEWGMDIGLDWPKTKVAPKTKSESTPFDPEVGLSPRPGLLSEYGYKVGKSGEAKGKRLGILKTVMETKLDFVHSKEYMDEWAEPLSPKRLKKLANTIASLTRNGKRKGSSFEQAVLHWESDLVWLKQTYYDKLGRKFAWPSTESERGH